VITIKQNYKSSTIIDGEVDSKKFVENFVLHGTALSTLDTLGKEVKNTSQRCFTLTGSYGTGKSTFAIFMSLLLSESKADRDLTLNKLLIAEPNSSFLNDLGLNNGWKTVKHVCGLDAPAEGLANSILRTLENSSAPRNKSDHEYVDLISTSLSNVGKGADGVLILLDEMGKALDYLSRENRDLHFFQELADAIEKSKTRVVLVGFLHQSFAEYARSMTSHIQREWGKVQGRYRDISYAPSIDESLLLIGETVIADEAFRNKLTEKYTGLVGVVSTYLGQNRSVLSSLKYALPIDPVVSLLLGPISKRSFSQNERSLFGFLASNEKLSFNQFVNTFYKDESQGSDLPLYNAVLFWQYLSVNLDHIISASRDGKIWLEAKDSIYRASLDGGELHEVITKTVALITMFGFQHQLFARREFLESYFFELGYEKKKIKTAIKDLENWKVLIYRDRYKALAIFQGSDVDVNELVASTVDTIKDGIDWVGEIQSTKHILATAHYHKKGTMRWADVTLLSERNIRLIDGISDIPKDNEPFLYFFVPTSASALQALHESLSVHKRVVYCRNITPESLKSLAIEQAALRKILKINKALAHDKIAKEEITIRLQANEIALENELETIFTKAEWLYRGKSYDNINLNSLVSIFADEIYSESPVVINELVNRNKPSGSANSAIKKLVLAMAENYGQELLGLPQDTFPAEKGLYFSCLRNYGIHKKVNGEWCFTEYIDDDLVDALFNNAHELLVLKAQSPVWLSEIDAYWAAPPYGLTKGIRTIWLMAFVLQNMKKYAFYDKNESTGEVIFITQPDDEFALKLLQKPQSVAVQAVQIDQDKTAYLNKLAEALDSVTEHEFEYANEVTPLRIAEGFVTFFSKLSSWTVATKLVSAKGRKFIEITRKASDPHDYLFKALPSIFDTALDSITMLQVKELLGSLRSAHQEMISDFEMRIKKAFGQRFITADVCKAVISFTSDHKLKSFSQRLNERNEGDKRWVSNIISLLSSKAERNWDDLAINRASTELPELVEKFKLAAHRAEFKDMDSSSIKLEFQSQVSSITKSLDGLDVNKKRALLVALLDELK
jgi:hypothetical protein